MAGPVASFVGKRILVTGGGSGKFGESILKKWETKNLISAKV